MAEMVLRVTPEKLKYFTDDLSKTSLCLQKDLEHMRTVLSEVHASVESPGITHYIQSAIEQVNQYNQLSRDLEELSKDLASMTKIYQKAETGFIESIRTNIPELNTDHIF